MPCVFAVAEDTVNSASSCFPYVKEYKRVVGVLSPAFSIKIRYVQQFVSFTSDNVLREGSRECSSGISVLGCKRKIIAYPFHQFTHQLDFQYGQKNKKQQNSNYYFSK